MGAPSHQPEHIEVSPDYVYFVVGWTRLAARVTRKLSQREANVIVLASDVDAELTTELAKLDALDNVTVVTTAARRLFASQFLDFVGDKRPVVILCEDDDVGNVEVASQVHEITPSARIVIRMHNDRIAGHLRSLLGDCHVLSPTRIATRPLADSAVGEGSPARGHRRPRLTRMADSVVSSDAVAIGRQLVRRRLFRMLCLLVVLLIAVEYAVARQVSNSTPGAAFHSAVAATFTLGFADFGLSGPELASQSWWWEVVAVSAVILDAIVMATLFGLIADAVISERFARVFGGSARRMAGHVVIVGLGSTGIRLCSDLVERGYRCVAIEGNADSVNIPAARRMGVSVIISDARHAEEFQHLGLERAVALIACTDDDIANLEAAFTAASIAPELRIVVRLFDEGVARQVERLPSIHATCSVSATAAPTFVERAMGNVSSTV
jgi:Trk K+ transport system NAD-binding subunit